MRWIVDVEILMRGLRHSTHGEPTPGRYDAAMYRKACVCAAPPAGRPESPVVVRLA